MIFFEKNFKLIGYFSIALCIITWLLDIFDMVLICPYCRIERSAIGILGLLMIMPNIKYWLMKYISLLIACFAFIVAANQHFIGWALISTMRFDINNLMPFTLSAASMAILMAQAILIYRHKSS